MEISWTEVATQVPAMALLCVVVWFFLKHLANRDDEFQETVKTQTTLTSHCVDKMVDAHERTVDSLDRNTVAFSRVSDRLDQLNVIENERLTKQNEQMKK